MNLEFPLEIIFFVGTCLLANITVILASKLAPTLALRFNRIKNNG
jgi:hypothetical protein